MISDISKTSGCEMATSNRARCHHCSRKIAKGTPRLIFIMNWTKRIKDKNGYKGNQNELVKWAIPIKRSICFKCAEKSLELDIKSQKQEISRLKKIRRQFRCKMKKDNVKELIINSEIMESLEKE